jgi:hypothetical protein
MGPVGYLGGPNVATIHAADYCFMESTCQEAWPDEFCSKYPPEGVPDRPRAVDDWGTKYNITSNMMTEGIKTIHERGGKVVLAYGGTELEGTGTGITAQWGGGDTFAYESTGTADGLARRIYKNIVDWDLDGVDFLYAGNVNNGFNGGPGNHVGYHLAVIKALRKLVRDTKTISYSTIHSPFGYTTTETAVIAACHRYLDYITIHSYSGPLTEGELQDIADLDVPLSKIGFMLMYNPSSDEAKAMVEQVKELGMAGITLFTINKENEQYRGHYARMLAEALYL